MGYTRNVHVAGYIAGRHAPRARNSNHDVGVVLADTPPGLQDVVDGGGHRGAPWHVVEDVMQLLGQHSHSLQRVVGRLDAFTLDEGREGGRRLR